MKKFIATLLFISLMLTCVGCTNSSTDGNSASSSVADTSSEIVPPIVEPTIEEKPQDFTITLSFLGDMLLACQKDQTTVGSFNEYTNKYPAEYFLEKVRPILQSDDFTVANLETVLTDRQLNPIEKNYDPAFWFKARTTNINILTTASVDAVLLNNNHTGDYGSEGYNDTVNTVLSAGMQYGSDSNVIYFEKNGFKIAVLCTRLWGSHNANQAVARLKEIENQSDYQIVMFHGGTEKIHAPEQMKVNAAHLFVDNGADLVVGGHPHVLQPKEIYNGVEIIYSLGNFCYGGHRRPENRTIIYQATVTVGSQDLAVKDFSSNMIPCYVYTGSVNNYQPAVIKDEVIKQQVIDFMEGKTDSPI